MDIREIEEKLGQYSLLCQLYAEVSCELTRRSKLSQEETARTCKVYEPYVRDVLQQVNMAIAIFVMEKELNGLKGRGHFPCVVPFMFLIVGMQMSREQRDPTHLKTSASLHGDHLKSDQLEAVNHGEGYLRETFEFRRALIH